MIVFEHFTILIMKILRRPSSHAVRVFLGDQGDFGDLISRAETEVKFFKRISLISRFDINLYILILMTLSHRVT